MKLSEKRSNSSDVDKRLPFNRLVRLELSVNRAMNLLLEPGDRRFMALGWDDGLCVYDGWTEYALRELSPRDIFGDHSELFAAFGSGNAYESVHVLIDFAQGTIYAGDEASVENFLEEVVDEYYRHSPLFAVLDSAVGEKLDGNTPDSV